MGLKEIMEKYGEPENKEGWFSLSDKLIRIPVELREYISLEDGKLVEVKPVPEELQGKVDELKEAYRKAQDPEDLTEYRRGSNE